MSQSKKLAISLPREVVKKMEQARKKTGETRSGFIRRSIELMLRERAEIIASSKEDLVVELLPVADNLERAVASIKRDGDGGENRGSIVKGVELTLRMFQGILGRYGIERMVAVGARFDPHRHEALMQEESDEVAEDTVAEELEPGYTMRDRVVRPARVKVKKAKAPVELGAPEGGGQEAEPPEGVNGEQGEKGEA